MQWTDTLDSTASPSSSRYHYQHWAGEYCGLGRRRDHFGELRRNPCPRFLLTDSLVFPPVSILQATEMILLRSAFSDLCGCRALASTALLAYVLGLRHALDADHISVGVKFQPSSSFNQLISLQGNRFNDPEASSGRATSHHGRNVLLSGAFNVCITIS